MPHLPHRYVVLSLALVFVAGCAKTSCPEGAVYIPPGTFVMGSDDREHQPASVPAHKVTLTRGYCIDRTEVTRKAYRACQSAGACYRNPKAPEPPKDRENFPAVGVTHELAAKYCAYRGGRLPTEAEWEYAARGNDGRKYPWGNDEPTVEHMVFSRPKTNDRVTATNVGSRPKGRSAFGLDDMAGNVAEWVSDVCGGHATGPVTDPAGPAVVLDDRCWTTRGAPWSLLRLDEARVSYRQNGYAFAGGDDQTGMRCAYAPH